MKRILLTVLSVTLSLAAANLHAEQLLLAQSQNFGPRKAAPESAAAPSAPAEAVSPAKPQAVAPAAEAATTLPAAAATPAERPVAPPAPVVRAEATRLAQDEVLRRQEAQITARALIDQGARLYYDGRLEEAVARFEEALKILPRARATELDYNRAVHFLTDALARLAADAYRAGEWKKAQELANKALQYDPNNRIAENVIVKSKQAEREKAAKAAQPAPPVAEEPRLDQTPEFVAKKDQIKRLFREGKILLESGQYDEAEMRFKQVMLLDPYNADAHLLLERVNKARYEFAQQAGQATRMQRLWEVADAWLPPLKGVVEPPKKVERVGIAGADEAVAAMTAKLNEIIIPQIRFREAVISDVVTFLSEESRRLDPKKVGVNIVLGAGVVSEAPPPPAAAEGAPPTPPPAPSAIRPVTLSLNNVPLIDALRYVTTLAGLKYRIEANAVLILPLEAVSEEMITRSYPVEPGAMRMVIAAPGEAAARTAGGEELTRMGAVGGAVSFGDVKQLFTDAGVPFPPGSSIIYNERTSTLIVRNTPENMEIFERVLAAFNVVPVQVEIEAKFVEISQADLNELGFRWKAGPYRFGNDKYDIKPGTSREGFPPGTPPTGTVTDELTTGLRDASAIQGNILDALLGGGGILGGAGQVGTLRGILTNPQFELVIRALAMQKGTDLLSAPKVTTISGAQAQIRVVQEFIYPSEYSEPQVGENVVSTSIPQSFKTRELGVLLNVTPTVGPDRYTINLTLIPEVSEFQGFIDYSPAPSYRLTTVGGTNIEQTVAYKILQPLFSSRNLTTSIVIWDGQTVVLGGLMREDIQQINDKVPLLGDLPIVGRLFRSKVTSRSKRNLLIFVTANLIDPAGNRIHREMVAAPK